MFGPTVAFEIGGRNGGDDARRAKFARDEARVFGIADPHGEVETFVEQIDEAVRERGVDLDFRKSLGERDEGGNQLRRAERNGHR